MRKIWLAVAAISLSLSACSGGPGTATPTTAASPVHAVIGETSLCSLLTPADFTAVGVSGASTPDENITGSEFYCAYAGASVATGGIEMDAFVYDTPADIATGYASLRPSTDITDVRGQVPRAEQAEVGTAQSGGPVFAIIAVRSGNLTYGIGIPPNGDWRTQLVALAGRFIGRIPES